MNIDFKQKFYQGFLVNSDFFINLTSLIIINILFIIKNKIDNINLNKSNKILEKKDIFINSLYFENEKLKSELIKCADLIKNIENFNENNNINPFKFFFENIEKDFKKVILEYNAFEIVDNNVKPIFYDNFLHFKNIRNFIENYIDLDKEINFIINDKVTIFNIYDFYPVNTLVFFSIITEKTYYLCVIALKIDYFEKDIILKNIDYYKKLLKNRIFYNDLVLTKSDEAEKMYQKAFLDSLTEVFRREKYEEYIKKDFRNCKKNVALIMFDLDKFKSVNDTYGHSTGDMVIKKMAEVIKKNIRSEKDIAIRYGGEEFLAIIQSPLEDDISKISYNISEKIRMEMESYIFISTCGKKFINTVSIGIFSACNFDYELSIFYENADKALYQSKKSGRNKVTVYNINLKENFL